MQIIYKKTKDLIPYENNPRNNDNAVDYVAKSIKEFGFKVPIVISKDNVVITGHTRLKASEKLGIEEIPCILADDLTEEQVKAYRLADNKVSEFSSWDFDKLDIELESLKDLDFELTDFGFEFAVDFTTTEKEINNTSEELNLNDFEDETFKHECPKCGFKFND